ncbi:hypothetical protein FHW68_004737 [Pseudomonas sp. Tn43]|uniref:hypothetical protein n=1 Tax=unclassified Pseudomonas TaxID=196821 RepID=UPI000BABFCF7|nr:MULTISPECIES: hypothetical protein [unclassified Pseudomonas]MBB3243170.1 hypothetical protein [Pseudomonas sp. Tn43]PAU61104.1 hypothetical protein BZL43_05415 [Pseudomonas sp. PICF141]
MNLKTSLRGWLRHGRLLALLAIAPSAEAATQEIRALFTPDPANPLRNEFVNKTPESGYCEYYPDICRASNTFSLRLMTRLESNKAMQAGADPRNSAMFKVPGNWRRLTVTNAETGRMETVEVRIAGIGSNYVLSDTAASLTGASNAQEGHNRLWKGYGWVNSAPPCETTGVGFYGASTYAFFWKTPNETPCVKTANFTIPGMTYGYLDFAYELRTPNPLGMFSGLYTGSLSYRLGPGGDFDFGDVMIPNDPDLTLDFVLDVQHILKVDIPPGGEKVQLVPAGGWQSWLQAGRRPVSLFRDQTFNISASSRFKMQLECETPGIVTDCQIINPHTGGGVELQVSVSLPNGLNDLAGQPVKRRRLRTGQANALHLQPAFYVDNTPGVLHFEVPKYVMEFMLLPGMGGRYSGRVTVIWDSEV